MFTCFKLHYSCFDHDLHIHDLRKPSACMFLLLSLTIAIQTLVMKKQLTGLPAAFVCFDVTLKCYPSFYGILVHDGIPDAARELTRNIRHDSFHGTRYRLHATEKDVVR